MPLTEQDLSNMERLKKQAEALGTLQDEIDAVDAQITRLQQERVALVTRQDSLKPRLAQMLADIKKINPGDL